jgi:undecaprenyl-diphosphatase
VTPLLPLTILSGTSTVLVTGVLLARNRTDIGAPRLAQATPSDGSTVGPPARRTPAFYWAIALIVAGAALLLGALTVMVSHSMGLAAWDYTVERWAANNANGLSTQVLTAVTQLGSTWFIICSTLVAAGYAYLRTRRSGIIGFLTMVVVGQVALSGLIKWSVARARPTLEPLADFSGYSFPSGHTTAATATYLGIALVLGLFVEARSRAGLMGIAGGLAVAVGCSRALLGVHWFTDVVAGLLLGWFWFCVCSVLFDGRQLKFRP